MDEQERERLRRERRSVQRRQWLWMGGTLVFFIGFVTAMLVAFLTLAEETRIVVVVVLVLAFFAVCAAVGLYWERKTSKKRAEAAQTASSRPAQEPSQPPRTFVAMNGRGRWYQVVKGFDCFVLRDVGTRMSGLKKEDIVPKEELNTVFAEIGSTRRDLVIPRQALRRILYTENASTRGVNGGGAVKLFLAKNACRLYLPPELTAEAAEGFFDRVEFTRGRCRGPAPAEEVAPESVDDRTLLRVRLVVWLLTLTTLGIFFGFFFFRLSHWILFGVTVTLFVVLLLLYVLFPGCLTLTSPNRQGVPRRKECLLPPLLGVGLILIVSALFEYRFVAWNLIFLDTALAGGVLFALLLTVTREYRRKKSVIVWMALVCLLFGGGLISHLNVLCDTSAPEVTTSAVYERRGGFRFSAVDCRVEVELPDGRHVDAPVDPELYERLEEGDEVAVCVYRGAFGIPYVRAAEKET